MKSLKIVESSLVDITLDGIMDKAMCFLLIKRKHILIHHDHSPQYEHYQVTAIMNSSNFNFNLKRLKSKF